MACDKALLVHAYVDGELDPPAILEIEAHLGACAGCRLLVTELGEMRALLQTVPSRRPAPRHLAARISAALDREDRAAGVSEGWGQRLRQSILRYRQALAGAVAGAALAAAAAIAVMVSLPTEDASRVEDELANAHLRSLMPDHLLDVASADGKTIAPWFKRQLDAAPPVIDLRAQGFDLQGGRTDVIDGHRVAAVVYRQGNHVVNLFVWSDYELDHASVAMRAGYNLFMWPQRHLAFCAVSDLSVGELKTLAHGVNAGMAAEND